MSYAQFSVACLAGAVWYLLRLPQPDHALLGFLAGSVIYNLATRRRF